MFASTSSKHEVFMNVYSGSGGRSCVELAGQAVLGGLGTGTVGISYPIHEPLKAAYSVSAKVYFSISRCHN